MDGGDGGDAGGSGAVDATAGSVNAMDTGYAGAGTEESTEANLESLGYRVDDEDGRDVAGRSWAATVKAVLSGVLALLFVGALLYFTVTGILAIVFGVQV